MKIICYWLNLKVHTPFSTRTNVTVVLVLNKLVHIKIDWNSIKQIVFSSSSLMKQKSLWHFCNTPKFNLVSPPCVTRAFITFVNMITFFVSMLTSEIIYFQPHFSHSREISLVYYLIYTLFMIVLFFIFVPWLFGLYIFLSSSFIIITPAEKNWNPCCGLLRSFTTIWCFLEPNNVSCIVESFLLFIVGKYLHLA